MQKLYRGYIKTKGKVPAQKFKNIEDLLTLKDADILPEYAGVLAENVALIDIDTFSESEILFRIVKDKKLKCKVNATSRGKHFYFYGLGKHIKCGTHVKLACGLTADIKIGDHNSISVLKYEGELRKTLYDIEPAEEYEAVPVWLAPVNSKTDFTTLLDGDGRNQALFNYILTLQSAELTIDEIRNTIKLINEYVLPNKLDEAELEKILRDEAFQKPYFFTDKGVFKFDTFANYFKDKCHVIKLNGVLHIYNDTGSYIPDNELIEKRMLEFIPTLKTSQRKEVFNYLKLVAPERTQADKRYILFSNGIYDLETQELLELSPDYVIPNQIPHKYNEDAQGEEMEKALSSWACGNREVMDLLEEVIGYTLLRENTFRKFFIIVGTKRNGKSKFLSVLSYMLGTDNISTISLEELGERFKNTTLSGKLANCGDDIEDARISRTATLKKLVSGEGITVEHKGVEAEKLYSYATLIFSANKIPAIDDPTGAVRDRMIIVPFNAHFNEAEASTDPYIMDKLSTEDNIEYLIQRALDGLDALMNNKQFTIPKCVTDSMERYLIQSDSISAFVELNRDNILGRVNNEVYRDYELFCQDKDIETVSQNRFSRRIEAELNCTSKATNGVRRYTPN
ncbi:MAG: phage/plasmid primase, P4 family [Clostridia bacterium]|nr:phage/plasmid primase, P4 family [Clostridia bacterium]